MQFHNILFYCLKVVLVEEGSSHHSHAVILCWLAVFTALQCLTFVPFGGRAGLVTADMLAIPKARFIYIGFFEALSMLTALVAASNLPGVILPILNQSLIVWQFLFSALILGQRWEAWTYAFWTDLSVHIIGNVCITTDDSWVSVKAQVLLFMSDNRQE